MQNDSAPFYIKFNLINTAEQLTVLHSFKCSTKKQLSELLNIIIKREKDFYIIHDPLVEDSKCLAII